MALWQVTFNNIGQTSMNFSELCVQELLLIPSILMGHYSVALRAFKDVAPPLTTCWHQRLGYCYGGLPHLVPEMGKFLGQ